MCFTGKDYDIHVYNNIFNYSLHNILIYFQDVCLFLYLGPSRWEDKVTATMVRGSSDTHEAPPERVFVSGLMMLIFIVLFCVTMVICYNGGQWAISHVMVLFSPRSTKLYNRQFCCYCFIISFIHNKSRLVKQ